MNSKNMHMGVNTHINKVSDGNAQFECVRDCVDFLVCHTDPHRETLEKSIENNKKSRDLLESAGIDYIINFEFQNFIYDPKCPDGTKWSLNTGEIHRLAIPEKYMSFLREGSHFKGIEYDELEHAIINENLSIIIASKGKIKKPVFPLSDDADPLEQGKLLENQLREYADEIKKSGAEIFIGEHVFPVLFHTFARTGITPNFKSQKESVSNIQFATAAGAALEYRTPLWNCVDCWFRNTNPGHSADEMYNNLVFAYYAGVNNVYVESTSVFTDGDKPNEYAEKFRQFSKEYRGKDRDYDIHDYLPEIGIIRYDDTYWGQGDPFVWKNMLFGNKKIKPDGRSKEYIKIFSMLTHGETPKGSFSWDKVSPHSLSRHRSFVTLNSTAVFDDRVTEETLKSLKLCFLSGIFISEETLKAVENLVKENGLTVVTPKRFAPAHILKKAEAEYNEITDGKGLWIVTDDIAGKRVKKKIKPFLGNKNEIRLTFENREVIMKISPDGNGISIIN